MIRELTYRQLYVLVAAMLAIISCNNDDTFIHGGEKPIAFSVAAEQQTRATTYGDFTGKNFGVEATCYTGDYKRTEGTTHMSDVEVTYDDGSCATNGTYYWPDGNMHFAAYAPHNENIESPMEITLPAKPYAGYKFEGTVDGKTNLMFANEQYGTVDAFTDGTDVIVPILFNHALTQVKFQARLADGTADDIKLTINSLKINKIFNKGSITFHHNDKENFAEVGNEDINQWNTENKLWTVDDEKSSTSYDVVTEAIENIGTTETACGNPLYLMPQQLTDNQQLEVTYTITSGGVEGAPITKSVPLKNVGSITQWTVNKSVLYTLIVEAGKPLTLTVTAQPWTLEEFTNEFSNTVTVNTEPGNDGRIKWTAGTYEKIEADKVVLKDDISIPAELKFTIAGPLGNTWQAILVTKSGDPGAFILSQTEGAIGEECTLTIKAKQQNTSNVSNQAELLFVVRTSSGILPVDILTTLGEGKNYTIIQNINK